MATLIRSRLVHRRWAYTAFFRHYLHKVLARHTASPFHSVKKFFPDAHFVFRPWSFPPNKVRVLFVVAGSPYMRPELNHGYALSVPKYGKKVRYPPPWWALLDEYSKNLGYSLPKSGSLESWYQRGIMLIYHLPVHDGVRKDRYMERGWEFLAYSTIQHLSDNREGLVFVFLGETTWYLSARVDQTKHLVLRTPYPSNMTKFRGCGVFTTILNYLGESREFFKLPTSRSIR